MHNLSLLFHEFSHRNIQLSNRIVMAPMTRSFSPNHIPTKRVAEYYRRRAAHGVGLIITEGTCIDHPAANGYANVPFMFGDEALAAWQKVVGAVHAEGGKIIPQLWHVGAVRRAGSDPHPSVPAYSSSGIAASGQRSGRTMTQQDIQDVIDSFKRAAHSAREIGFDGIELHGAHGYLIDQFFWRETNHRGDKYGGSIKQRTRFAQEIIQTIRNDLGDDFLVVLRWSQWKMQSLDAKLVENPDELRAFLQPLAQAGVDIFHCSTRRFWDPVFPNSELTLAGWTRKVSGLPTIAVGSVGMNQDFLGGSMTENSLTQENILTMLAQRIQNMEFDLVAVGRALIADPAWPEKVRTGNTIAITPFNRTSLRVLE